MKLGNKHQNLGPSINHVSNFSEFLTPPSRTSAVFLVIFDSNFDQFLTPVPIADVVYGQPFLQKNSTNVLAYT
jgi:hypothetical protein